MRESESIQVLDCALNSLVSSLLHQAKGFTNVLLEVLTYKEIKRM